MARYIDAEELYDSLFTAFNHAENEAEECMLHDTNLAPVIHAHWIVEPYRGDLLRYACSNPKCKYYEFHVYKEYRGSNYCPDCGAKQRWMRRWAECWDETVRTLSRKTEA